MIASLLLSLVSLSTTLASRRDAVNAATLAPMRESLERTTVTAASALAATAQIRADMKDMEIRMLRDMQQYPMKDELERVLDERFEPILRHIIKTETFMEEVLRSGALAKARVS